MCEHDVDEEYVAVIKENHGTDNDEDDGPTQFITVDTSLVIFIDDCIYRVHEIELFIVVFYVSDQEDSDNDKADCEQDSKGDSQDVRNSHFSCPP